MGLIQIPTNDLQKSLAYYEKLGFKSYTQGEKHFVAEEALVMEINPQRAARAAVKLYREDWSEVLPQIEALTKVLDKEEAYLFADPSGCQIQLMKAPIEMPPVEERSKAVLGNFMGYTLEMIDAEKGVKIWEILGFKIVMGGMDQGYMVLMNDEKFGLSIMKQGSCPHLFFNPSLTYFNGKENLGIIANLRALNVPIAEEITHFNKEGIVDNVIIQDPGGLGFFLFSD